MISYLAYTVQRGVGKSLIVLFGFRVPALEIVAVVNKNCRKLLAGVSP
jgi:hypothetical protein